MESGVVMIIADKNDELLEIVDENGEPTGRFEKREIVHGNQLFHNEIALWIIDKENRQVLVQRRSKYKKQNPNKKSISNVKITKKFKVFFTSLSLQLPL